jgi:hypothetical protein
MHGDLDTTVERNRAEHCATVERASHDGDDGDICASLFGSNDGAT